MGYSILMALLSPWGVELDIDDGGSRLFTWPFRIFCALLGCSTLISVRSRPFPKTDWRMCLFLFFWGIYLLRAFYDLEIRTDMGATSYRRIQAWFFIIFSTGIPILGILKSIDLIDFKRISNWIFYVGGVALVLSLFSVQKTANASLSENLMRRENASAMLNTISFGHLGLSVAIVAFYRATAAQERLIKRILGIIIMLLGAYIMLRAGSRGPLLCAFVVAFFYLLSKGRYAPAGLALSGIFAGLCFAFLPQILVLINNISPAMASRLEATLYEGDSSGRDSLISEYWKEICDNPLTGGHLDLLGYSHNACFDGFLMFGIPLGWIIFALVVIGYFACYRILKRRPPDWWTALLAIQSLTACQTSGTFGGNGFVQCLWVVCIVWTSQAYQRNMRFHDFSLSPDRMNSTFSSRHN